MLEFALADADCDRLGIPCGPLKFSLDDIGLLDLEQLEDAGYGFDQLAEDLRGRPVLRAGAPVLGEDGKPLTRVPFKAMRAALWIAVRQLGSKVRYDDFDVSLTSMQAAPEGESDQGKDPAEASAT
jgi:hypothetical protein